VPNKNKKVGGLKTMKKKVYGISTTQRGKFEIKLYDKAKLVNDNFKFDIDK